MSGCFWSRSFKFEPLPSLSVFIRILLLADSSCFIKYFVVFLESLLQEVVFVQVRMPIFYFWIETLMFNPHVRFLNVAKCSSSIYHCHSSQYLDSICVFVFWEILVDDCHARLVRHAFQYPFWELDSGNVSCLCFLEWFWVMKKTSPGFLPLG